MIDHPRFAAAPSAAASLPQTGTTFRAMAQMLGNETTKHVIMLWHRRGIVFAELAVMVSFFVGVQYLVGGGKLIDALLPSVLLGFLPYIVAYVLLVKIVAGILEEMHTGTLEQMYLSPLSPSLLSLGLLGAVLIQGVLIAAIVGGGLAVALDLDVPLAWGALVPALLTLLDLAGFALFVGGIALTVTSIGAINHVIYSIIGMLNGTYVPVNVYPDWLQIVAKFLPSTLGIDVMRRILLEHQSLASTWTDHSLQWTVLHAAAMLVLGWTVYQAQIRRGLREGRLGPR